MLKSMWLLRARDTERRLSMFGSCGGENKEHFRCAREGRQCMNVPISDQTDEDLGRVLRSDHSSRSLSPIHSVWCFHPRLSAPRGLSEGITSYFVDTGRALEGLSVDSPADGDQYFVINAGSCSSIFLY